MKPEGWNWISLQFDREAAYKENKKGEQLIPLFLDHILTDSCSQDMQDAFAVALFKFFSVYGSKEKKELERSQQG